MIHADLTESTLFSFASRHHTQPFTDFPRYQINFAEPTGLHPSLQITFPSVPSKPNPSCALHTYLTLPSSLFMDKYQFSSPNFLSSNGLRELRALSGETDLEAPLWAVSLWGSAFLLELDPPARSHGTWVAKIPLSLLYLPSNHSDDGKPSGSHATTNVPWPVVFWACPAEAGNRMNTNPFDRRNLGYDGLFGPKTLFYHLQPTINSMHVEKISVPLLGWQHNVMVERLSVFMMVLGFLWACWKLVLALGGARHGPTSSKGSKKE